MYVALDMRNLSDSSYSNYAHEDNNDKSLYISRAAQLNLNVEKTDMKKDKQSKFLYINII